MKIIIYISSFSIIAGPSAISLAANGAIDIDHVWWQALLFNTFIDVVLPIFGTVLSALAYVLLRKLGLKVELDTLDSLATQATHFAEHQAKRWVKETGEKASGVQKEEWAWQLINTVTINLKLKEAANAKLRKLILAKVGEADRKGAPCS